MPLMTDERLERIRQVAAKRQPDLTVVLENVHDRHNIGAVLRTCDSVGISDVYILNNSPELIKKQEPIGKSSASGAKKWLDIHVFTDTEACFEALRMRYRWIFGTHLDSESTSLYQLDMTQSVALVFGNEHAGITEQTLPLLDGNFIIPQVGMVQSLNISVACAVSLYEAYRQRELKGLYDLQEGNPANHPIAEKLIARHEEKFKGEGRKLSEAKSRPERTKRT